ncbi:MAG: hypothetical protein E7314_00320 [Clostridiales bacterium]|nr:hypothetical protein [Clostridiales bacterium]
MDTLFFDMLVLVVIPLIVAVAIGIIIGERTKRTKVELKLKSVESALSQAKSHDARIIHVAYFGAPVDHLGDGFVDGEE